LQADQVPIGKTELDSSLRWNDFDGVSLQDVHIISRTPDSTISQADLVSLIALILSGLE